MMKKITKIATAFVAAAGLVLIATPSFAADPARSPVFIQINANKPAGQVDGFWPSTGPTPPSPPVQYPTADPVGYQQASPVAQLFDATTILPPGDEVSLYGVQVEGKAGATYESVPRSAVDIGNAGYVARIVAEYYPNTNAPDLPTTKEKIAAVQAAIWYFTGDFVVARSSPLHDTVAQIVNDTIAAGPLPVEEPDLSVALNGPNNSAQAGTVLGPFTVQSTTESATFTIDAGPAKVYSDAAGTALVPARTALESGAQFWLRSDTAGTLTVTAFSTIDVSTGQYFMDGDVYQPMIAATATPHAVASAAAEFTAAAVTPTPAVTSAPVAAASDAAELADTGSDAAGMWPFIGLGALLVLAGVAARVVPRRSGVRSVLPSHRSE